MRKLILLGLLLAGCATQKDVVKFNCRISNDDYVIESPYMCTTGYYCTKGTREFNEAVIICKYNGPYTGGD